MDPKYIATQFLTLAAHGKIDEAYEKYVSHDFIHHNQYFAGDRETLKQAMKDAHVKQPNKAFEVKNAIAQDDLVAVHSLVRKEKMDIAVVHICRIENGKIAEMWDVGQVLDPKSPNKNGAF